jgi:hypothetical protein
MPRTVGPDGNLPLSEVPGLPNGQVVMVLVTAGMIQMYRFSTRADVL